MARSRWRSSPCERILARIGCNRGCPIITMHPIIIIKISRSYPRSVISTIPSPRSPLHRSRSYPVAVQPLVRSTRSRGDQTLRTTLIGVPISLVSYIQLSFSQVKTSQVELGSDFATNLPCSRGVICPASPCGSVEVVVIRVPSSCRTRAPCRPWRGRCRLRRRRSRRRFAGSLPGACCCERGACLSQASHRFDRSDHRLPMAATAAALAFSARSFALATAAASSSICCS